MRNFLPVFIIYMTSLTCDVYAQFSNGKIQTYAGFRCYDFDSDNNIISVITHYSGATYLCKSDSTNQQIAWTLRVPDTVYTINVKVYDNEIYVATSYWPTVGPNYIVLTKISAAGNVLWAKKIFSPAGVNEKALCVSSQKKIYIGTGVCAYWNLIICLDSLGNQLWAKTYSFPAGRGFITSIDEGHDGNMIITSSNSDLTTYHKIFLLFKINTSGNVLWNKFYEVPFYSGGDAQRSSHFDSNHNMYFNYNIEDSFNVRYNVMLSTDANGNLLWVKKYSASQTVLEFNSISDFAFDGNENLFVLNYYDSFQSDTTASVLIKLNAQNGNIKSILSDTSVYVFSNHNWERYWNVKWINPNRVILLGDGYGSPIIVAMDSSGSGACNFVPAALIPQAFNFITRAYALSATPVALSVADTLNDWNPQTYSIIPYCATSIGMEEITSQAEISFFPNPATNELRIESAQFQIETVDIYDLVGTKILHRSLQEENKTVLDVRSLSAGIYFVAVRDKQNNLVTRKIVKM